MIAKAMPTRADGDLRRLAALAGLEMLGDNARDSLRHALAGGNVQELVRTMGIAVWPEHAGNHELRAGNFSPSMPMKGIVPPSPM